MVIVIMYKFWSCVHIHFSNWFHHNTWLWCSCSNSASVSKAETFIHSTVISLRQIPGTSVLIKGSHFKTSVTITSALLWEFTNYYRVTFNNLGTHSFIMSSMFYTTNINSLHFKSLLSKFIYIGLSYTYDSKAI